MVRSHRLLIFVVVGVVAFQIILALAVGLDRPTWGDEWHFVETVRLFGDEISMHTRRHYDEMSTPLPFVLYGLWGRLIGFEIERLRLLSLLLAVITYIVLYSLLFRLLGSFKTAVLGTGFVMVHPYMLGFSLFVFTDMSAIMFMLAACLAMHRGRPVWFALMLAGGLLCRQYLAFVFVASLLVFAMQWYRRKSQAPPAMLTATVLSALPLALLFLLWGDVHPDNLRKQFYLAESFRFHPSACVLYVSQLFWYLVPVLLFRWRCLYRDRRFLIAATAVSLIYFAFPVTSSAPALRAGMETVGFMHRFLLQLAGDSWLPAAVFYVGFLLGLPLLFLIVKDAYNQLIHRRLDYALFLDICIVVFVLVMPWSYLTWEKYFMPLLPLAAARFLMPLSDYPQKAEAERPSSLGLDNSFLA
jgi:hypothetical protein